MGFLINIVLFINAFRLFLSSNDLKHLLFIKQTNTSLVFTLQTSNYYSTNKDY